MPARGKRTVLITTAAEADGSGLMNLTNHPGNDWGVSRR